jgi:hypothetical protein
VIAGIGHRHLGGFVGTVGVSLALLPRLSTATALALQRLARRGAVTQRSVIEELVLAADEQAAAGLTEEEWAEYFSVTR